MEQERSDDSCVETGGAGWRVVKYPDCARRQTRQTEERPMLRPTKRDWKIEIEMPNPRSDPHLCISAVEKGMSHYVRNRAHVWSTKEVQIIDRFKSAEISAKCAKARI